MMVSSNRRDDEWMGNPIPIVEVKAQAPQAALVRVANLSIPLLVWEQIGDYIHLGHPPGPFLHAVLCNDLQSTCAHADDLQMKHLRELVLFIYNFCPAPSWGSPESVASWLEDRAAFFRRHTS